MTAPLVLVTSIPRRIATTLPSTKANATVDQRFGALVAAGGGLPIVADAWSDPDALIARVDAIVLNGGTDVAPGRYGAKPEHGTDPPDLRRDAFEFGLVEGALRRRLPILGICRGMQLLNVALGGTLVQDVRSRTSIEHYVATPNELPVHPVEFDRGSVVSGALEASVRAVNSVHHQAVDQLGEGLRAVAWAPDGTIEAIEDSAGRLVGVQWHPEFLAGRHGDAQIPLFAAFVAQAKRETALA
jgi:putative glutamine amidotransferase